MAGEDDDLSADWGAALAEQGAGDDDLAADWGAALEEQGVEGGEQMAAQWAAMIDDGDADIEEATRGADRVLNQEEIDNLLGFNLDEHISNEQNGIRALINSALVSYERLPMLEIVFDRLVRETTTSLRNFTSDNVEVSLDSISSVRFGDYLNSIPLPAILAVFKAEQWDNFGLITVDSSLIYSIIDVLLGGGRGTTAIRVEGRPYTTIETNLVRRMIDIILADAEKAFAPLTQVKFNLERLETNPRFAAISRPANAAILVEFRVDMEDRGGKVEMLLPYATIEPIRELLLQMFMGEKFGRDATWEGHLATEVFHADLEVDAVMCEEELPLSMMLDLAVGQTLVFNVAPTDPIAIKCGDIHLTSGNIGRYGENVSIKVSRPLRRPKMTLAAFEKAAQKELEKT
ncbi:flagellar motor switch protein FliM [Methylobrevis albus]|uniref:Flagellar motor switch protein FliM n=1 Tax=Methylobrevis albus TaxID=2793297 RepID=A0A931MXC8_9HYPH|nr:flagellar motor switch protein FliM [Methylobrevis albus]MBH0236872.1 flagellar motor switch protein FliM [Methylobrevis albus]